MEYGKTVQGRCKYIIHLRRVIIAYHRVYAFEDVFDENRYFFPYNPRGYIFHESTTSSHLYHRLVMLSSNRNRQAYTLQCSYETWAPMFALFLHFTNIHTCTSTSYIVYVSRIVVFLSIIGTYAKNVIHSASYLK